MSSDEQIIKTDCGYAESDRGCTRCGITCEELYCSIECACYDGAFSVTKGWLPSGIPPEEDNGWVDK